MDFPPDHPISSLYRSRTIGAESTIAVQRALLQELTRVYAAMVDTVLRDRLTGDITRARASRLLASLRRTLFRFRDSYGATVDQELASFINDVIESHAIAAETVADELGVQANVRFGQVDERVVRQMMVRRQYGFSSTFKTFNNLEAQSFSDFVNKNIAAATSEIDDFITSSVARGLSARRFQRELATLLIRDDPVLRAAVQTGRAGSLLDLDEVSDEVRRALPQLEKLLRRMRTIAVTETNNAHDEANRFAAQESSVVGAIKWQTSGRHDGLHTSPDECDVLEQQNAYGLGAGLYPPEVKPVHPHPNCACTMTYELRDPEDWGTPNPDVPDIVPRIDRSAIRRIHRENGGEITNEAAETMVEQVNALHENAVLAYRARS